MGQPVIPDAAGQPLPSAIPPGGGEPTIEDTGERRIRTDRRTHSVRSFLYGGVRPRRRLGRRDGDHDRIFLDWHEPQVMYLAIAIVLMSCADALFTLNLLAAGAEELNGFMRTLIGSDIRHFLWVKIGITAVSVVFMGVAARRRFLGRVPVLRLLQLFCGGYAVLIAYEIFLLGNFAPDTPLGW